MQMSSAPDGHAIAHVPSRDPLLGDDYDIVQELINHYKYKADAEWKWPSVPKSMNRNEP